MAGLQIIKQIQFRWRLVRSLNAIFLALGLIFLAYSLFKLIAADQIVLISSLFLIPGLVIGFYIFKPWKISVERCAHWIDATLNESQNSAYLLLQNSADLSALGMIQQGRVSSILEKQASNIKWPESARSGFIWFIGMIALGAAIQLWPLKSEIEILQMDRSTTGFIPLDSTVQDQKPLTILSQEITINYPDYSKLKTRKSGEMNLKALEGSLLSWRLELSEEPLSIDIVTNTNRRLELMKTGAAYQVSSRLKENGYYKISYMNRDSAIFESELYRLEVIRDEPPSVEIEELERFTLFEIDDDKSLSFITQVVDDYGITGASITATVSKGSGESVKFREEKLMFDNTFKTGSKTAFLKKRINLNDLKMTPGDELYFYIEAVDNMRPGPNKTRTETYFVSIRDTAQAQFSLEGSLGVDLMPEYFRSQRQIIIDTEKLIKTRGRGEKSVFNSTSNELGFDQKSLRLKYGQFMGEEFETGIGETGGFEEGEEDVHDHDLDHDHEECEEEDPLEAYSHKHDHENDHNLVPEEEEEEDPLEEYSHIHDDPEEATLYTKSIKGKLKAAMTEMWDAELYLRLYEPEKSLPYQYRALELIKEIKNHARIYVHRIGFDPPPLKEDKRLTGDLEYVTHAIRSNDLAEREDYPAIEIAISYLDSLIFNKINTYNNEVFRSAGSELAALAVDNPGSYFNTLQTLQQLNLGEIDETLLRVTFIDLQRQLIIALPESNIRSQNGSRLKDELTQQFLNQLEDVSYE